MCSCNSSKKKSAPQSHVVALPGGRRKSYLSLSAAQAEVNRVPGAYLVPPQTQSS